jgi:hypothetical protein
VTGPGTRCSPRHVVPGRNAHHVVCCRADVLTHVM